MVAVLCKIQRQTNAYVILEPQQQFSNIFKDCKNTVWYIRSVWRLWFEGLFKGLVAFLGYIVCGPRHASPYDLHKLASPVERDNSVAETG